MYRYVCVSINLLDFYEYICVFAYILDFFLLISATSSISVIS
jgi:hypothetical protein